MYEPGILFWRITKAIWHFGDKNKLSQSQTIPNRRSAKICFVLLEEQTTLAYSWFAGAESQKWPPTNVLGTGHVSEHGWLMVDDVAICPGSKDKIEIQGR